LSAQAYLRHIAAGSFDAIGIGKRCIEQGMTGDMCQFLDDEIMVTITLI
jgi:hypothetical protein